jgi:4-amino-4-deoxy-L-arabinose transferase-like glycosyltransferase
MSATDSEHCTSDAIRRTGPRISGLPAWAFILLLSVAIRAVLLAVWVSNHPDFYRLGGEVGKVALSLMRTGQFANPYMIPTGSTAHPTPLSPALLAFIYHVFGMTATAGYVRALVGISSHSALYALLPWFARRLGLGTRAGVFAGVTCALVPFQGLGEAIGLGDTAHAALTFGFLTVAFLHRWTVRRLSVVGSLLLGMACGAAFHILPPLLLVVSANLIFELWWKRDRRKWLLSACVAVGAILACVPWTWRNYTALRGLFFIRSNFGLELRIANHPGADADMEVTHARAGTLRHPSENLEEARQVRDLGEGEYNRRARNEALAWIRNHPTEFLRLTLMRFLHFWCGQLRYPWLAALFTAVTVLAVLGLRRILPALDAPGQAALLIPLAAFPLVYYIVSYVAHYPMPLSWMLFLLAGYEVQSWISPRNHNRADPARSA